MSFGAQLLPIKELRIVIVLASLDIGGAEKQAVLLANLLSQGQANVTIMGMGVVGPINQLCQQMGIACVAIPRVESRFWPLSLMRIRRLAPQIKALRPDVIISYTNPANIACALIWKKTGAQRHLWFQRDEGMHRFSAVLERLAIKRADKFCANSRGSANFLIREHHVPLQQIHIIENCVSLAPCVENREKWRAKLLINEHAFVAGMIANFTPAKDHETLIQAWHRLDTNPDQEAVLILAGQAGPYLESLKKLADGLPANKRIVFLNRTDDISGLLSAVDLGIYSSTSEGCPNGILEYMASKLAVVGTEIAAISDILANENAPFLAPKKDAATMAKHIYRLAGDPLLRNKIGQANLKKVLEEFTREIFYKRLEKIIT